MATVTGGQADSILNNATAVPIPGTGVVSYVDESGSFVGASSSTDNLVIPNGNSGIFKLEDSPTGSASNLNIDASNSTGDNTLVGNSGDNTIITGKGESYVNPGKGNDDVIIPKDAGKVTIDLSEKGQGNDVIEGFRPKDDPSGGDQVIATDRDGDGKIDINDLNGAQYDPNVGGLVVQFADGTTTTFKGITSLDDLNFVVANNSGSGTGGDGIIARALSNQPEVTITTGSYIEGTEGSDSILGNKEDNTIDGRGGDDWIDGGKGNDVFLIKGLNQGHDTLANLNIGDKLQVYDRNSDGKLNINDLDMKTPGDVDSALTHEGGNTTINFADGTKVTLEGVNIKSFSELNITLHGDDYAIFQ